MGKTSINSWIFCFLLFFSPLVFVSNTKELFEFPKTFFVYVIGCVIVCLFLTKFQKIKFGNKYVFLFLLANLISTIFSSHLYTSIWGYYSRFMAGFVSILVLFGVYVFFINTFSKDHVQELLTFSLIPVVLVSIFGIYQHFDGILRVYSTFGQPNWLAQYLAMQNLVCLGLIFGSKRKPALILIYLVSFVCLWFTYSISGMISWLVGLTLFIYLKLKEEGGGFLVSKSGKLLGFLFLFSCVVALCFPGIFKQKLTDVFHDSTRMISTLSFLKKPMKIPVDLDFSQVGSPINKYEDRNSSTSRNTNGGLWSGGQDSYSRDDYNKDGTSKNNSEGDDKSLDTSINNNVSGGNQFENKISSSNTHQISDSTAIRLGIWKGTINLIFSSPKNFIIGTGPQTFPYVFQQFRPAILNYSSEWNFIVNRPHNYYLEVFSELGLLGFISWIYLNIYLLKKAPKILLPSVVVFSITNFFSWPVVATWVLFFFWLGVSEIKDET